MIIHPFAFRVHTHGLGRVVSGWKVTADQTWTLLGKRDPQLPQMFEEIKDKSITLRYGDTLGKTIDTFYRSNKFRLNKKTLLYVNLLVNVFQQMRNK